MSGLIGQQTKYFNDVKCKIIAGMEFGTKNYKLKVVGYDIFRHYLDNNNKDCQVGTVRLKRVIK